MTAAISRWLLGTSMQIPAMCTCEDRVHSHYFSQLMLANGDLVLHLHTRPQHMEHNGFIQVSMKTHLEVKPQGHGMKFKTSGRPSIYLHCLIHTANFTAHLSIMANRKTCARNAVALLCNIPGLQSISSWLRGTLASWAHEQLSHEQPILAHEQP